MPDVEDAAIVRLLVRVLAAAVFCLLCGGVSGVVLVRQGPGGGAQQVELAPTTPPRT